VGHDAYLAVVIELAQFLRDLAEPTQVPLKPRAIPDRSVVQLA
jgi:hypothetical protein